MEQDNFLDEFHKLLNPVDKSAVEGKSLKDMFEAKLVQYGLTFNQAEKLLSMQNRSLQGILDNSAKRVDVVNLLKLGQFLGLNTETLMKLYITDAAKDVVEELDDARKKSFIVSNFDIKNLFKVGFLDTKSDFEKIEKRIVGFFGLDNIYQYSDKSYIPAFSRTKRPAGQLMKEFWVRSAFMHFEKIANPNDYDRRALINLIPKIRPYTMNVERGLRVVTQALYNVGLTVIYQPHLPTTQVRGATFIVNGKPGIVLTDLNKNYATVWFALMHEIYHVLYDLEEIESQSFHLTGEPDLFLLQEDKANEFSREYLFSRAKSKYISSYINSPHIVREYAGKNQVHPSLVYNFFCFDSERDHKGNYWGKFRTYQPDIKVALQELNINTFENTNIEQTIEYLNNNIFNF